MEKYQKMYRMISRLKGFIVEFPNNRKSDFIRSVLPKCVDGIANL